MIEFRLFKDCPRRDLEAHIRWQNDSTINHLFIPCFSPQGLSRKITFDDIWQDKNSFRWMIYSGGKPVGDCTIQVGSPQPVLKGKVAWLSMVLGEKEAWGKGIAGAALEFLLAETKHHSLAVAEVGVFQFNERSLRFWKKHGFEEFCCIPKFIWWNGRQWADIRLKRAL